MKFPTRFSITAGAALLALSATAPAFAAGEMGSNDGADANYEPPPTERRDGFFVGLRSGVGLASLRGYPNELGKIDNPAFEEKTGIAPASSLSLWLGAALRDWLTYGIGASTTGTMTGDNRGGALAFLLHFEAFPFFELGPFGQDFGITLEGGIGVGAIFDKDASSGADPLADGGAMSTLGIGAFWEPVRFWHMSLGPSLDYTHAYSRTLIQNQLTLGLRLSFYGEQPPRAPASESASAPGLLRF